MSPRPPSDPEQSRPRAALRLGPHFLVAAMTLALGAMYWSGAGHRSGLALSVSVLIAVIIDVVAVAVALRRTQLRARPVVSPIPASEPARIQVRLDGLRGVRAQVADATLPKERHDVGEADGVDIDFAAWRSVWPLRTFDVSATGPFGIVGIISRLDVPLVPELLVGPDEVDPADDTVTISMLDELTDPAPDRREQTRSLRPYRPGDPRRMVHWAATARHGELLVRELEGTTSREVRIGLELISGTAASAHAVQRCAALVTAARHRGDRISLATVETDEPTVSPVVVAPRAATRYVSRIPSITRVVERPVTGPEDLLSRLARAVPGRLDSVSGPMFVLGELESGWRR